MHQNSTDIFEKGLLDSYKQSLCLDDLSANYEAVEELVKG